MEVDEATYAGLLRDLSHARSTLRAAGEKLRLYRAQHSGEYVGGVEYTTLMRKIEKLTQG